jgi:NAD(P)-dependent dehydrogenase (short-subunit alcohol dehydrogenase family)
VHSSRNYVVTGSASGMGAATKTLLESQGCAVIGVDRHDADVVADLSTAEGRQKMVAHVEDTTPVLDGVLACAGISGGGGNELDQIVRVNYFSTVGTLEGLHPLLTRSTAPRAVTVASLSGVLGHLETTWREELVEACLAGDEEAAVALRGCSGPAAYASVKRALIRWTRRMASTPSWAGSRILLNVVAPGLIRTPINDYLFATPERAAETARLRPQPLGWGRPEHVASLLAWLGGPSNEFVTGQLVCIDGGYEALVRPDVV